MVLFQHLRGGETTMPKGDLPYWKALAAFDFTNEQVLQNQKWRLRFPDTYERLDALMNSPPPEWGKLWIPHSMLVEMARQTRLHFATNEEWLISTIDRKGVPAGYKEISALEALKQYGPEQVFEAADKASSRVEGSGAR
jgi:hypothetical protein